MCAAETCTYTVSTKQQVNRCKEHPLMGLLPSGPCSCCLAYVYPPNAMEDGCHWFVTLNADKNNVGSAEFNGQLIKMLQTQLYNGMQDKRTSGLSIYKYDES